MTCPTQSRREGRICRRIVNNVGGGTRGIRAIVTTREAVFRRWIEPCVIHGECRIESRRTVAVRTLLARQQGRMRKRRGGRRDTRRVQSIVAG